MHINEADILGSMLYEAIFQADDQNLLPIEIIKQPELSIYIDNWGQEDDLCYVAEVNGEIIGAVWTRILSGNLKGFGNIDNQTPEFAISLYKEYRNQGIGTELMKHILLELEARGYEQASLSVQKENYAFKMYLKIGFEIFEVREEEYLMVYKFKIL